MKISSIGPSVTLVNAAALEAAYVASAAIDLHLYDGVTIYPKVTGTGQAKTLALKPEWSHDGTDWHGENAHSGTVPAATSTEQPQTELDHAKLYSMATVRKLPATRFARLGRYFRISVMENSGSTTTTALLTVTAAPCRNNI